MSPTDSSDARRAPETPSASARAISRIKAEHRAIGRVIAAMQTWVVRCREQSAAADPELFAAMLRYVREVPDRLHHPREDSVLFPMLAAVPEAQPTIGELQREHAEGVTMLRQLALAFGNYRKGAPNAVNVLSTDVDEFAEFYWAHMRKEEDRLLPIAQTALSEAEWARVASAFCEAEDPLFRAEACAEYRRLYAYIAALSPADLRGYVEEAAYSAH